MNRNLSLINAKNFNEAVTFSKELKKHYITRECSLLIMDKLRS